MLREPRPTRAHLSPFLPIPGAPAVWKGNSGDQHDGAQSLRVPHGADDASRLPGAAARTTCRRRPRRALALLGAEVGRELRGPPPPGGAAGAEENLSARPSASASLIWSFSGRRTSRHGNLPSGAAHPPRRLWTKARPRVSSPSPRGQEPCGAPCPALGGPGRAQPRSQAPAASKDGIKGFAHPGRPTPTPPRAPASLPGGDE